VVPPPRLDMQYDARPLRTLPRRTNQ